MTSLYRRHRPQTFAEVVGQEHVVRTLSNAIEQDKLHHAYLFVGARGTGKTSVAKILARSLNCVNGPTLTPCGECESCRTIAESTSMDVIEMDAASHNSVDDIRELREKVAFVPAGGHWKVYILDEAHMLSSAAWNAFLKTLEEPPPRTIFVLATTEAHKVMATIVDRCQRFDFRRPSIEQLSTVLKRVAAAEGIAVPDEAVMAIARSATGSFRDALGTLDQLVTFSGSKLALDDVLAVLGVTDADEVFALTDRVIDGDPKGLLLAVEELAAAGGDLVRLMRDLEDHWRSLLIVRTTGVVPESFGLTDDHKQRLSDQAGRVGESDLIRAIDLVGAAIGGSASGADPRLQLELALMKTALPASDRSSESLLARIERLEAQLAGSPVKLAAAPPAEPKAGSQPEPTGESPPGPPGPALNDAPAAAAAGGEPQPAPVSDPEPEPPAQKPGPVRPDEILASWPNVLEELGGDGERGHLLTALLADARPRAVEGRKLHLRYPAAASFHKRKAEDPPIRKRIAAAIEAATGHALEPVFELDDNAEPQATAAEPALSDEELAALLKKEFDAEEIEE